LEGALGPSNLIAQFARHLLGKIHSSIAHSSTNRPGTFRCIQAVEVAWCRRLGALHTFAFGRGRRLTGGTPRVNGGSRGDSLIGGGGCGDEMPKHGETEEIYVKQSETTSKNGETDEQNASSNMN